MFDVFEFCCPICGRRLDSQMDLEDEVGMDECDLAFFNIAKCTECNKTWYVTDGFVHKRRVVEGQ